MSALTPKTKMQVVVSDTWTLLAPNPQSKLSHFGALVIRVGVGLFIAGFHGWHKLAQGIAYIQSGTHWPLLEDVQTLGLPLPVVNAFAATIIQLVGGVAVAAGFLTRFAAFAVAVSLCVAAYSNLLTGKDNQLALLYAVIFFGFSLYGGGWYSVDAKLFGRRSG